MPSPFPGIDPYLEAQGFWPDFHASFALYCRDALNDGLPPLYEARLGEQVRLVEAHDPQARGVVPDVAVFESTTGRGPAAATALFESATVTLDLPTAIDEVRDVWIEIRHRPDRSLVTAIEILSPINNSGQGYYDYAAKRRRLIHQDVHLIELDFLLEGRRLAMAHPLPPGYFYAFVSRAQRRPKCDVLAWSLRQPPPRVPIPLRAPDPDVFLDLPALFAISYDRGRYRRSIHYLAPLDLPLTDPDRLWARELAKNASA